MFIKGYIRTETIVQEKLNENGSFLRINYQLYLQFETFFRRTWPVWIFPSPAIRHLEANKTPAPDLRRSYCQTFLRGGEWCVEAAGGIV